LIVGVEKYNFPLLMILSILQGMIFVPFMPLTFDYSCDVFFPAGEAQITGCLITSCNVIGMLYVISG